MRFRATLAGLMTAVLLFLSPAVAYCEIKCELAETLPSCHSSSPVRPEVQQDMPDMPGMERQVSSAHESGDRVLRANAASCEDHTCLQPTPILRSNRILAAPILPSAQAAFHDVFEFEPEPLCLGLLPRGPPQLNRATPITFRTTLRV